MGQIPRSGVSGVNSTTDYTTDYCIIVLLSPPYNDTLATQGGGLLIDGYPYAVDGQTILLPPTHHAPLVNQPDPGERPTAYFGDVYPRGISKRKFAHLPPLKVLFASSRGIAALSRITVSYGVSGCLDSHPDPKPMPRVLVFAQGISSRHFIEEPVEDIPPTIKTAVCQTIGCRTKPLSIPTA